MVNLQENMGYVAFFKREVHGAATDRRPSHWCEAKCLMTICSLLSSYVNLVPLSREKTFFLMNSLYVLIMRPSCTWFVASPGDGGTVRGRRSRCVHTPRLQVHITQWVFSRKG
jgi:hypothetical protein